MNGIFRMDYSLAGAMIVTVAAEEPYVLELPPPNRARAFFAQSLPCSAASL
jgi:hypothetical protein